MREGDAVEALAQRLAGDISAVSEPLRMEQARLVAADVVRQRAAAARRVAGGEFDYRLLLHHVLLDHR